MDLLPGFSDYFRTLTSHLRAQIWGFTLPYSRRRKAGDPQALHAACAQELARLTLRLDQGLDTRLQEEYDLKSRQRLYTFPREFAALGEPLLEAIEQIFLDSKFDATQLNNTLRGVFFTSAAQAQADAVADQLSIWQRFVRAIKTARGESSASLPHALPDGNRSYFLHDLLTQFIFREAHLVDPEYDPEYLLLFSRAAPQAEAQYGDFVSTPEAVNWPEIERDARRLLTRSKDIRVLILLLRSRIQQAGAQGLAEMLTQLAELSVIWSDALHPQLLTGEGASAESIEDAALARSNALAALLDHEGVMADIRGITLSNSAALRLQVRDVERALSAPRPADALAPESVRQQLADLEARGALPLAAFREAQESAERLQVWARETLGDLAPDFSRLRQLLALLPDVVQTTTPEIPPSPAPDPAGTVMVNAVPARAEDVPPVNTPPGISLPHNAEPGPIRDRNDALERLRCIRRWFESSEPSSPTIPLLRQAERLVGKRFSEVINEIPVELLEKWDALE